MKNGLVVFGLVVGFAGALIAIPNNIGGFINPAGMRFEEYVLKDLTWSENANLKGDWELWRDEGVTDSSIELIKLKQSAIIFGLPASEVTALKKDDTPFEFRVRFETGDKLKDADQLSQILKRNIGLYADGDWKENSIVHEALELELKADGENGFLVRFRQKTQ